MDWGFLNIFKKAEFNTLMFAAAVACWVLYFIHHDNDLYLGVALLCTIYCIVRFVVYLYNWINSKIQDNKNKEYAEELKKREAIDKRQQAQYVFDRLGVDIQNILKNVVKSGDKSSYPDVFILRGKPENSLMMQELQNYINRDRMLGGWVRINDNPDTYCVIINFPLNSIIEELLN